MQNPFHKAFSYKFVRAYLATLGDLFFADRLRLSCPAHLIPLHDEVFRRLDRSGLLRQLRGCGKDLLIPLDGTRYFSSKTIHCKHCSTTTHQDGNVTSSHTAILPAIVMPGEPFALPLAPEFITPQDGHTKQDCETVAAKR